MYQTSLFAIITKWVCSFTHEGKKIC